MLNKLLAEVNKPQETLMKLLYVTQYLMKHVTLKLYFHFQNIQKMFLVCNYI